MAFNFFYSQNRIFLEEEYLFLFLNLLSRFQTDKNEKTNKKFNKLLVLIVWLEAGLASDGVKKKVSSISSLKKEES